MAGAGAGPWESGSRTHLPSMVLDFVPSGSPDHGNRIQEARSGRFGEWCHISLPAIAEAKIMIFVSTSLKAHRL